MDGNEDGNEEGQYRPTLENPLGPDPDPGSERESDPPEADEAPRDGREGGYEYDRSLEETIVDRGGSPPIDPGADRDAPGGVGATLATLVILVVGILLAVAVIGAGWMLFTDDVGGPDDMLAPIEETIEEFQAVAGDDDDDADGTDADTEDGADADDQAGDTDDDADDDPQEPGASDPSEPGDADGDDTTDEDEDDVPVFTGEPDDDDEEDDDENDEGDDP